MTTPRRMVGPLIAALVLSVLAVGSPSAQTSASTGDAFPEGLPSNQPRPSSSSLGRVERGLLVVISGDPGATSRVGFMIFDADGDVVLNHVSGSSSAPTTTRARGNLSPGTYFVATYRDTSGATNAGPYVVNRGNASLGTLDVQFFDSQTNAFRGARSNLSGTPTYFSFVVSRPSTSDDAGSLNTRASNITLQGDNARESFVLYTGSGSILEQWRRIGNRDPFYQIGPRNLPAGDYYLGVSTGNLDTIYSVPFRVNALAFTGSRNYSIDLEVGETTMAGLFSGTLRNAGFEFFEFSVRDEGPAQETGATVAPGESLVIAVDAFFVPRLALYNAATGEKIAEENGQQPSQQTVIRTIELPSGLPVGEYELAVASGDVTYADGFFSLVEGIPQLEDYTVRIGSVVTGTQSLESRDDLDFFRFTIVEPQPCSDADLAEPFQTIDGADYSAFESSFLAASNEADYAQPSVIDAFDLFAFLELASQGCPQ